MRVMIVARLFSGLADGLNEGRWLPRGVPAISRLLEGLAARDDIETLTVFACKDDYDGWFRSARCIEVKPIGRVAILPWAPRPGLARLGLDGKLREISHLTRCLWFYFRFRPDVTYFTNANFVTAGVFARLRLGRVILRFLGLHPEQKRLAEAHGGLQRWLYRSPFNRVICSLDGSGGGAYLPKLINQATPLNVLLNGVDHRSSDPDTIAGIKRQYGLGERPLVSFVGRLEANKGCREFLEAVCDLLRNGELSFDAAIVGDGSLFGELEQRIADSGMQQRVCLVGSVPHETIGSWLELTSIYVSLNYFGSLSNANLEAVAAGKCVIILEKDATTQTDIETESVLPHECVIRIDRENMVEALAATLKRLISEPKEIAVYSERARLVSEATFATWENRIEREIDLISA